MQEQEEKLPDLKQLNIIKNIQFTNREIDIIACLLHGRGAKKISDFLLISPKTVEVHIRNIMLKIGCNFKGKIIDFLESSDSYLNIVEHYHAILKQRYNIQIEHSRDNLDNSKIVYTKINKCKIDINPETNIDFIEPEYITKINKYKNYYLLIFGFIVMSAIIWWCYSRSLLSSHHVSFNLYTTKSEPKYLNDIIINKLAKSIDQENLTAIKTELVQAEKFLKQTRYFLEIDKLKYHIGRAYRYLGEFKAAIGILENINHFDRENNIYILAELGINYLKIGAYEKAVLLVEKALINSKKQYGIDAIQTAYIEILLDTPYRKLKKYQESRTILEHSLKIYLNSKELQDLNVAGNIAWIYTKLGFLNIKFGQLDEAINLFNKSLAIQINLYGEKHIRTAWTYVRKALAYQKLKDYNTAKSLLEHSFQIYKNHYGKHHIKTAWILGCLAEVEFLLNNYDQAKQYILETLLIQTQHYGKHSVRLSWALNILSKLSCKS